MKRETVLKAISEQLGFNRESMELLAEFYKENKELSEFEFYEKLQKTFPWFELSFKYQNALKLNKIEKHLFFFKVLTIVSLVFGAVAFLIFI